MANWTARTEVVTAQAIAVGGFYDSPVISNQGYDRTEVTARWSGRAATLLVAREVSTTIGDVPDYYYPVPMQRVEGTNQLVATVEVDASDFRIRIVNNGDNTGPLYLAYRQAELSPMNTELPNPVALADGMATPTTPIVGAAELLFNGTSYDRARNGPQDAALAAAVTLSQSAIIGAAASPGILNFGLLSGVVNGWVDARMFRSASIQVIGAAGITAGAIVFEQTNDPTNASAGNPWPVEEDIANPTPIHTAQTIGASTVRMFRGPITAAYVRVRVSTAFAGGNVQAIGVFSQAPYVRMYQSVVQNSASALQMQVGTPLPSGANTIGGVSKPLPVNVTDIASGAISATTTTAAITPAAGGSYQVAIGVTALTGTTPSIAVEIQESDDGGTSWYSVWKSATITAVTGVTPVRSPVLQLKGNRIRYVQTVVGTITRSIVRTTHSNDVAVSGGSPPITNGTIATGGTAQTVAAERFGRKYLEIQNTSTGDLWLRWNAVAGVNAGYRIPAGGSWNNPSQWCPDGFISIFGATTGQTFAFGEA